MKTETLNGYARRIDRAVELLNTRLHAGAVPSLQELADAAALSSPFPGAACCDHGFRSSG